MKHTNNYNDVIMSVIASQITSLTIVYSTVYSGTDQRDNQSFTSLALVRGIRRWPVNFLHKGTVTRKRFPFDDVIMTRQGSGKKQLTVYHVLRPSPLPYPALLELGPSVSLGFTVCFRLWSSPCSLKVFKSSDPAQHQCNCGDIFDWLHSRNDNWLFVVFDGLH